MRTVVTYLDRNKNRTTKEDAWTVMTQVYNDAGNLQRTGYSIGEAQKRGGEAGNSLRLRIDGSERHFEKNIVRLGRDEACDIVFAAKEDKKKVDKIHATFELREGKWHVMDMSKSGTWIGDNRIASGAPVKINAGDVIRIGQRQIEVM